MIKMVAESSFMHDGARLRPGQEFEASESDAADLAALGFAHRKKGIITEALEAVGERRTRRSYTRRDLQAEESE